MKHKILIDGINTGEVPGCFNIYGPFHSRPYSYPVIQKNQNDYENLY